MQADRDVIEPFVRGVLGCGCPDAVFRQLELGPGGGGPGEPVFSRLVVGGRLLVYLVADIKAGDPAGTVSELAGRGLAERNAGGYRRFRLAACIEPGSHGAAAAATAFQAVAGDDDRAHLHCPSTGAMPASLVSSAARLSATEHS